MSRHQIYLEEYAGLLDVIRTRADTLRPASVNALVRQLRELSTEMYNE
jgi:hypothetical protein